MLNRLMEAGVGVFGRLGLSGAKISDVAREMGVSQGTIYNYVESKEALFYLLVDWWLREGPPPLPEVRLPLSAPSEERLLERLRERIEEVFALPHLDAAVEEALKPPDDPAGELRDILGELYDRTAATRRAADMIERSARDLPALADFFAREVRGPLFTRMERYVRARTEWSLFRCPDPEAAARLLVETVMYAARHRHGDPQPPGASEDDFREATLRLLCHGLVVDADGGVPSSRDSSHDEKE